MSNKLFVGGLSWDTDAEGLREAFAEFGDITDATVVTDRESGRSRGFGFVTFADPEDAQTALREMNGAELDGRRLNVDLARDRASGDRRGGGGGGGGGGDRRGGGGGGGGGDRRGGRGGGGGGGGGYRDRGGDRGGRRDDW